MSKGITIIGTHSGFLAQFVTLYTVWLPNANTVARTIAIAGNAEADRWAAQQVDPLLLAGSALQS